MKIIMISTDVWPSYLVFRKSLIEYLVENNHEVYCFALKYDEHSKRAVMKMGAVPVEYNLNRSGMNLFSDFIDTIRLMKKIRDIGPDAAFSFFIKPSIFGNLAAYFAGVPRRTVMLEGLGYIYTFTPKGWGVRKYILRKIHGFLSTLSFLVADEIMFLNEDDPIDLGRQGFFDKTKFNVFGPIGLNLNDFPYRDIKESKRVKFVFIARLLKDKGILEYINAARIVKGNFPEAEFVVLGGVDYNNPAAINYNIIEESVKDGVITYPGKVDNVSEWISDSDVFVLPSYREGFPRSTQEAMATGRAIITTNVPGCRQTVVDGVNGFVIPPWDVDALAKKMSYLIDNPELIRKMGKESHKIALESYDVTKINPRLASIITGKKC